jgi:hypothetical protein
MKYHNLAQPPLSRQPVTGCNRAIDAVVIGAPLQAFGESGSSTTRRPQQMRRRMTIDCRLVDQTATTCLNVVKGHASIIMRLTPEALDRSLARLQEAQLTTMPSYWSGSARCLIIVSRRGKYDTLLQKKRCTGGRRAPVHRHGFARLPVSG